MVVTCAGMYRSASTLSYNIAKTLIERGNLGYSLAYPSVPDIDKKEMIISKCHDMDEKWGSVSKEKYWKQFHVIYSYRDIRSVICSFCQWREMTLQNFDFQGYTAESMINWLLEMDEKWRSVDNLLLLKYADYFPYGKLEVGLLTREIAKFLNINPTFETYTEIANKFNFDTVKKFTDGLEEGDKETLLNPKHLSDGQVGKWKIYFTDREQSDYFLSNKKLMNWLKKWDFEN